MRTKNLFIWAIILLSMSLPQLAYGQERSVSGEDFKAHPTCRLPAGDISDEALLEWADAGQRPGDYRATLIYIWDQSGYDRVHELVTRPGNEIRAKVWSACITKPESRYGGNECWYKGKKSFERALLKGKRDKKIPQTVPSDMRSYAAKRIGSCFGPNDRSPPRVLTGFTAGEFTEEQCRRAAEKKHLPFAVDYLHGINWQRGALHSLSEGQTCFQIPDGILRQFEREEAEEKAEQQKLAQQKRDENQAKVDVMFERGAEIRERTPDAVLYADVRSILTEPNAPVVVSQADPVFKRTLQAYYGLEDNFAWKDVKPLETQAARGCLTCAIILRNTYDLGLFGQTPNRKRAAKYAILAFSLSVKPKRYSPNKADDNFNRALKMVESIPDGMLGEFAPLKRRMDYVTPISTSVNNKQALLVEEMLRLVPARFVDVSAQSVSIKNATDNTYDSLPGIETKRRAAARVMASTTARSATRGQAEIVWSASTVGDITALQWVADYALVQGQPSVAAYHYGQLARFNPSDVSLKQREVDLYSEAGKFDEARKAADEADIIGMGNSGQLLASIQFKETQYQRAQNEAAAQAAEARRQRAANATAAAEARERARVRYYKYDFSDPSKNYLCNWDQRLEKYGCRFYD
ncbi:MAG: hypothetical protein AAGJ85_00990 [Pseudomonadota bacterium]